MKKVILVLSILLSGLSVHAQNIEMDQLMKLTEKTPILIDVRTTEEYKEGTIPGAMNLNIHEEEFTRTIRHFPKDRELIVFCQSGVRSTEAYELLKSLGFEKVSQLSGGYEHWKKRTEDSADK
ncbi:rhodanese-like domain-containing protein [Flavobacterium sp. CBA20B-1]|uniref:rhodanese-like domain-containing protein n=1 Tax=unclassified Flavobacterium TaxID=196869 RepID=UPI002225071B|nr:MULTISPECIES: rhodanese-like domain-containing protein [unclassified Flavobacterium]WCM42829.1 rhodanese-like domain-containing protein [Flavobacterium sp. CBA20B-1]